MNLELSRSALLPALAAANSISNPRGTLPILGHVLLRSAPDGLRLTATNLEQELTQTVPVVQADPDVALTLPARKLFDIVKNLADDAAIRIKVGGDRATLTAKRSRFQLAMLPAADFPALAAPAAGVPLELPGAVLRGLLDKTAFAMAKQDVRFYLNGVFIECSADAVKLTATDGHRLAHVTHAMPGIAEQHAIIPAAAVAELRKLVPVSDDHLRLEFSDTRLRATLPGGVVFTSVLVDGRFPEYQRVIPRDVPHVVTIERDALRAALNRVAILSNEKYRGVRMTFAPGSLKLQAANTEQEESAEEMDILTAMKFPEISIGFNVQYVTEVLGAGADRSVQVLLKDCNSSSVWRGIGRDDETFIIMPMRL